ncbi:hypothetical protein NMY22_g4320 [Coprinellus aureogranulatus]|nr:hypothetical protein NMY22_g4320 [Coprinellus aureogranulatus]
MLHTRIPRGYEGKTRGSKTSPQADIFASIHRRNASLPVNRLPPEILLTIFEILKTYAKEEQGNGEPPLSWFRVTFVCRRWRTIALDSPSLWTTIDCMNPAVADVMLARSKNALLDVSCTNWMSPRDEEALRNVLSQAERIRSF